LIIGVIRAVLLTIMPLFMVKWGHKVNQHEENKKGGAVPDGAAMGIVAMGIVNGMFLYHIGSAAARGGPVSGGPAV
jgi:hypothetical protein